MRDLDLKPMFAEQSTLFRRHLVRATSADWQRLKRVGTCLLL